MRLRSRVADAVYLRQHIVRPGFRSLRIVFRLHVHPQLRAIAKQCAQAQRHFRGDPATPGQYGMQCDLEFDDASSKIV